MPAEATVVVIGELPRPLTRSSFLLDDEATRALAGETEAFLTARTGLAVDDPHYFSYSYVGDGSSFTVTANGDLDCDGEVSTFEIVGTVSGDGTVTGGGGLYRNKELE